jgi:hypothetical protein
MKRLLLLASLSLVVVAAAFAAQKGAGKRLDRDSQVAQTPAASVLGELRKPRSFTLQVVTVPAGQAFAGYASISCRNRAYEFSDRTRPVGGEGPVSLKIPLTKRRAALCSVGVNLGADFGEGAEGRLSATLFGKRR